MPNGNTSAIAMTKKTEIVPFTPEQIDLIRKTVAKDATDLELEMFLHVAKMNHLDPILKEIIFIKRKVWNEYRKTYEDVPTIMVARDGFLAVAHKTGFFGGMKTLLLYTLPNQSSIVEGELMPNGATLLGAKCTIWNKSFSMPVEQSVKFSEYCVYRKDETGKIVLQALWATKPETMIKKVAEAQALRKAFNIHGVYAQEEMEAEMVRDDIKEIEHIMEGVKTAEELHSSTESYDQWVEKKLEEILTAVDGCPDSKELYKIKLSFEKDVSQMVERDRVIVMSAYENAQTKFIQGTEGAKDADATMDKWEADCKKFIKESDQNIKSVKGVIALNKWYLDNRQEIDKLMPEYKEYLKNLFIQTYKKLATDGDQKNIHMAWK